MKDSRHKQPPQGGTGDSPRPDLPYAQIPLRLLTLPTGERAAAIEVWAALHHHLRLGSRPERITDEALGRVPWLAGRSRRYRCNGLDSLESLGLIAREAGGSSRWVAITARLKGRRAMEKLAGKTPELFRRVIPSPQVELTEQDWAFAKELFPRRFSVHADAHN